MLQASGKRRVVWGLAAFLVLMAAALFCWLGEQRELPAWIQAVGSILAILFAIDMQMSASDQAAAEVNRAEQVRLAVARHLATQIMEAAQALRLSRDFISARSDWSNTYETLCGHYDQLGAFDCTGFKDPEVATAFLSLMASLSNVVGYTRYVASKGENERSLDSIKANCDLLERTALRFLQVSVET